MLPLQVLDFNGDRLNDVVLVARDGIYAWAQVRPAPNSRTSPHQSRMHVDAPGPPHLVLRWLIISSVGITVAITRHWRPSTLERHPYGPCMLKTYSDISFEVCILRCQACSSRLRAGIL